MAQPQQVQPIQRTWRSWLATFAKVGVGLAALAGVSMLLLVLAGVFHAKVPEQVPISETALASDVPQTEVRLIRRRRFETAVGTIKPVHESALASKLLARVVEVRVKAGQAVTQSEVLVRLDDADLQARLQQAEATESAAKARVDEAQKDFDRVRSLRAQKVSTAGELDKATATLKTAQAEVARSQQAVKEANVVLDYATIRSPMTGTVIDKRVEAGDTVTPGQVLLTLYDPARMQMVASVRESLAMRLTVGQTLPARLESLGYECNATVSEVVPEAQAASRSFTVKVTGPCPPGVYSGMFGRLMLPLDDEEVVVVAARAIRRVGQLMLVDVVVDGRLQRRAIQLGRTFDDDVEVLSGLRPGERVVLTATIFERGQP